MAAETKVAVVDGVHQARRSKGVPCNDPSMPEVRLRKSRSEFRPAYDLVGVPWGKVQDLRAGSPAAPRRRPRHGMTRKRTMLTHGLGIAASI